MKQSCRAFLLACVVPLIWLTALSAPVLGREQENAFFPNYIPTDPGTYCRRTLRFTFGRTGGFKSEMLGSVIVPYKTGSVAGIRFTDELEGNESIGISNDGILVRYGISFDITGGARFYGSTDCALSSHPAGWSFGTAQFFTDLVGQEISSGYIKVIVDKGVASFALCGTNDLSVLSAIPPQVLP